MARLLRWLVGSALTESIVGDLAEQRGVRARRSRLRAALWFWGAIGAVTAHALSTRLAEALRSFKRPIRGLGLWQDLNYSLRALRRTPGYAATVIGVLALGLTLATTVFAVVDGVLLKSLPYPRVAEVVSVEGGWQARPEMLGNMSVSASDAVAWSAAAAEVRFATFSLGGSLQLDDGDPARTADVSREFFDVLGQPPIRGGFAPGDFLAARPVPPIMITYACWQRRFSGEAGVLGRVIRGDRGAVEVVGILGPDFLFPSAFGRFVPEALAPLIAVRDPATNRGRGFKVVARLPPGGSIDTVQARLSAATADVAARFPKRAGERGWGPFDLVRVRPIDEALRAASSRTFLIVFGLSAALVLLACLNVTGLAAARAQDRRRELTLRRALGARGGDLLRLLGTESLVVVATGCALGLAAARLLLPVVSAFLPGELVLFKPLAIDLRVAIFAAAAAGVCVIVTTIWPARVAVVGGLRPALSDGAGSTRRRHALGRRALVGAQVATAFTIAIGGALLAASWIRVWQEDPGYRVGSTTHLWISPRGETPWPLIDHLIEDVRQLPGVSSAGGSSVWLLQRAVQGSDFTAPPGAIEEGNVERIGITSGFLEATGLRVLGGRWFTAAELAAGAPVVVVSERVARDYWRGRPAVGQTLARAGRNFDVVGIVGDARYLALDIDPDGAVYYPLSADPQPFLNSVFVANAPGAHLRLATVLSLLKDRHPLFRVRRVQDLATTLGDSVRPRTFQALLFGAFGAAAVVIVGVGVFGLAAIVTSRRTREIGVRLALGARRGEIVGLVMRQEFAAIAAGLLAGGVVAAWAAGLVRVYLYKMSVYDPRVWAAAALLLAGTAALGVLVPALRASRVDPISALRVE